MPDREKTIEALSKALTKVGYGDMDNVTLSEVEEAIEAAITLLKAKQKEVLSDAPGDAIIQFVTKAFETQDAFIFETIRPFCEERTNMIITKDELIRALTLLREQEPMKPKKVNRYIDLDSEGRPYNPETYDCGACNAEITHEMVYCPRCGKKVDWDA